MELSDHELMLAVREGETAQLGELFERHHRPLFGFFVRMTGQRTASEDLVQHVFYRILKYRHTYRDEGSFTAWMYHLARRAIADHFRKSSKTPFPLPEPEELQNLPDSAPQADELASRSDEISQLHKALASMPADQRELITLYRLQQIPLEELATVYECKLGTLKVRIHRALHSLREHYERLQS